MANNKLNLWKEQHTVKSYERDVHGLLNIQTVGNILQEAAGNHANSRGFGVEDLMQQKETWVLARLKIQMHHSAQWGDALNIETWVENIEHFFAERHFAIKRDGHAVAAAVSNWAVIDLERRRPKRVDTYADMMPTIPGKFGIEEKLRKLPDAAGEGCPNIRRVRFSELDILRHVNNVRYFDWVLDAYGKNHRENFVVDSFEINFLAEAHLDEDICIYTRPEDDEETTFNHSAIRKNDNREIIRARVIWRPIFK